MNTPVTVAFLVCILVWFGYYAWIWGWLSSFKRWLRTVPKNARSLRPVLKVRRRPTRWWIRIRIDPNFDKGDAHYWFHFTHFYVWIHFIRWTVQTGIKDTN